MTLPDSLEIRPLARPIDAAVRVPGSKSISNRALLLAALADGESVLSGSLDSDDTQVMIRALKQLGATIELAAGSGELRIRGVAGRPRVPDAPIDVRASGTAARFLTAALTLVPGDTRLDGIARMRQRPIQDLVDALNALGANLRAESPGGCPPVVGGAAKLAGGEAEVDASRSSQYVSAVLQVAPYAERDVRLRLKGGVLVSKPYVDVTLAVMREFGAEVEFEGTGSLRVASGKPYRGREYTIEPDASTAAYFFAAAAISGGRVEVLALPGASAQADMGMLGVLERMGATVERRARSVEVRGPNQGALRGVDVDMNDMPDAVLAVAVTAAFATGETVIRNVANLRIKESDRLLALETELRKLGVEADAGPDSLRIRPAPLRAAKIETYDDHRMAMAFALAGLRVPGVVIHDPACVSKSWPQYFDAFQLLDR